VGAVAPSDFPRDLVGAVAPADFPRDLVGAVAPADFPRDLVGAIAPSDFPRDLVGAIAPSDFPRDLVGHSGPMLFPFDPDLVGFPVNPDDLVGITGSAMYPVAGHLPPRSPISSLEGTRPQQLLGPGLNCTLECPPSICFRDPNGRKITCYNPPCRFICRFPLVQ
jgi:hypothetical protein